jgi:hypothetical protein
MLGAFWGLLFGLFFTVGSGGFFGVLAYGVLLGGLFGALLRAGVQYAAHGRRDFASVTQTRPDHYEVQGDDGNAAEAERVLARMPG